MFTKFALGVASTIALLAGASAASAQSWSTLSTTYDVGGVADLQHSVSLSCNINRGDLKAKVRSTAQNTLDISGVTYPFQKPFSLCGTVKALNYDWKLQITGPAISPGVYPVALRGVSAQTILGATCLGDIYGTFDNNGSVLVASGVIPATGAAPSTCSVAVDVDAPNLKIVP